jgi:hypothetical protein
MLHLSYLADGAASQISPLRRSGMQCVRFDPDQEFEMGIAHEISGVETNAA